MLTEKPQGTQWQEPEFTVPLLPTHCNQHPGAYRCRLTSLPPGCTHCLLSPPTSKHCTVIHGLKIIISAELEVPWLGLDVKRRGLHHKCFCLYGSTIQTCLHFSLYKCALLVKFTTCPFLSCNPHSLWAGSDCLSLLQAWERIVERLRALCLVPCQAFICSYNLISLSCITEGLKWHRR